MVLNFGPLCHFGTWLGPLWPGPEVISLQSLYSSLGPPRGQSGQFFPLEPYHSLPQMLMPSFCLTDG